MLQHRNGRGKTLLTAVAIFAAASLLAAACSEAETSSDTSTTSSTPVEGEFVPGEGDGVTVISKFEGAEWFDGPVPTAAAADESLEPVKVGFINVDSAPVAAMPELHGAVDGWVEFVNKELGGIDGHPVEVVACPLGNAMSPEEAAGCARKMVEAGVVAVLGGIGLSTGAALSVLAENDIPWIGGIPVNAEEMSSPISFQFSGGSPGAFTAMAHQAVTVDGAEKVAVIYGDFPSVKSAAVDYGVGVSEALGAEVTEVEYPLVSQDYTAPVQKAVDANPDAILVSAADLSCAPIMQALSDLGTEAQVYMVGSCADQRVIDQVGSENVAGTRFNIENRLNQADSPVVDTELYSQVMGQYAPDTTAESAATVAFRGAMNLWAVLSDLGPDAAPDEIMEAFRESTDVPSFDGHPYTCSVEQIPGFPAMCAPQQVLAELTSSNVLVEASDGWIDVPTILEDTINA
ncbi:MAG: ABC transporter substrate-binding protein [Actinomycetia bacterium]|nr:ABC transporter substrate-binding protein [Actinomycetes bacterium]